MDKNQYNVPPTLSHNNPQPQPQQHDVPTANPAGVELLARLTDALEKLGNRDRVSLRAVFEVPKVNGTGYVEYFLIQFHEVAEANEWNDATTLIHLRKSLKEDARQSGWSATL